VFLWPTAQTALGLRLIKTEQCRAAWDERTIVLDIAFDPRHRPRNEVGGWVKHRQLVEQFQEVTGMTEAQTD